MSGSWHDRERKAVARRAAERNHATSFTRMRGHLRLWACVVIRRPGAEIYQPTRDRVDDHEQAVGFTHMTTVLPPARCSKGRRSRISQDVRLTLTAPHDSQ